MLRKYLEEDFYELRMVASSRLSPDGISVFFIGAIVYSGILTAFIFAIGQSKHISNLNWSIIIRIDLIVLVLQLLVTIFYFNEKNAFRFQRFQAVLLSFISLKIAIEPYQLYFLIYEDRSASAYFATTGILLLIGGTIYLFISIMRAIRRVKQGEFRKGGKGLYNFQNSKGYISLPIIYGTTMIGGVIGRTLSNMTSMSAKISELFFILLLCVIMQYGIALAWPEFFLLTYCKYRFKSFNHKMPNILRLKE